MKHTDLSIPQLLDYLIDTFRFTTDYAGFPPFIRGNTALGKFPQLVERQKLKSIFDLEGVDLYRFENQTVARHDFLNTPFETIAKLLKKQADYSFDYSVKTGFWISAFEENPMEKMALIRALRSVWYFISETQKVFENQVNIWVEVTEKSIHQLPLLMACQSEFLIIDDLLKSYIDKNRNFILSHSIDPFAGNIFLEEKTYYFVEKICDFVFNSFGKNSGDCE